MKKILKWAGIIVIILILVGMFGSKKTPENKARTITVPTRMPAIFDVPSLIGKDVNEVKEVLGKPEEVPIPAQQKPKEWDMQFHKDGQDLLVTYEVATGKIVDFFIDTNDPSGATSNKRDLLDVGNVIEYDPHYTVEFVPTLRDSSMYTGVKIIPTQ